MTPECRRPGICILRHDRTQMAYDSIIDLRLTASQSSPLPFNASRTSDHMVYTHSHRLCLDLRQVSIRFMFPQDLVSVSVIDGFIVSSTETIVLTAVAFLFPRFRSEVPE